VCEWNSFLYKAFKPISYSLPASLGLGQKSA
jgi:hypothetical protein